MKIKDTDNQIINLIFIGSTTKNEIILRNKKQQIT